MLKLSFVLLLLFLTSACQIFKFKDVAEGRLQGEVVLVWVGDDDFIFVPSKNSIHYTTSDHIFIKPDAMFYTDGGSIPKVMRSLEGFPLGHSRLLMSSMIGCLRLTVAHPIK